MYVFISYFTISASIEIVKDKENTMEQAGFIGGSALFGYILGAFSRRARLLKKLVYSGTLGGGAGYVCYPEEMTAAANYAAEEGNKLGLIAYNFIAGGKLTQPSTVYIGFCDQPPSQGSRSQKPMEVAKSSGFPLGIATR